MMGKQLGFRNSLTKIIVIMTISMVILTRSANGKMYFPSLEAQDLEEDAYGGLISSPPEGPNMKYLENSNYQRTVLDEVRFNLSQFCFSVIVRKTYVFVSKCQITWAIFILRFGKNLKH